MGLAQSALILLGIGIVSSRFKAGTGLGELGEGITSLVSAPLRGTGLGLSSAATGIRDIAETFGDLGRGLSELFDAIPKLPGAPPGPPGAGGGAFPSPPSIGNGSSVVPKIWYASQPLVTMSGGSANTLLAGGGGNVKPGPTLYPEDVIGTPILPRPAPVRDPTRIGPGGGLQIL